jgi:uncharacterized protein (TIGR02284 family)
MPCDEREAGCVHRKERGHEKCKAHVHGVNKMKTSALWQNYSPKDRDAVLSALQGILDACRDGAYGYGLAAQDVQDPRLRELFGIYAIQRRAFGEAIEKEFVALGGMPRDQDTLGGRVHRKWLEVRASLDHGSAISMLAECERGENTARARYEHSLSVPMPEQLRDLLLNQLAEIRLTHDQLDRMRGR